MNITFDKKEAYSVFNEINKIVKGYMGNILCVKDGDRFKIISTDFNSTYITYLNYNKIDGDVCSFLLPIDNVLKCLSVFKGDTFDIVVDDKTIKVKSGRNYTKFLLGDVDNYFYKDDFVFQNSFVLKNNEVKNIVSKFSCIVDENHSKLSLRGVYFDYYDGAMNVVCTDGVKLGKYVIQKDYFENNSLFDNEFNFLPNFSSFKKSSFFIRDNDLTISFNNVVCCFSCGESKLFTTVSNVQYPNYRPFFPKDFSIDLNVSKQSVIDSLNLIKLSLINDNVYCKLSFNNGKMIFQSLISTVEIHEEIDVDYDGNLELLVSPSILSDIIKSCVDDTVKFSFNSPIKPFLLSFEDFQFLLMPAKKTDNA